MSDRPTKILRVDWYASDFLAGMAGHKLGLDGWGAYIGIISICYAEQRPTIPENEAIARLASMSRCNPRTVRKAIEALVQGGKLTRTDAELEPKRVRMELERTLNRIRMNHESGAKGGRPSNKNKELAKGLGLFSGTLIPTPTPKEETGNETPSLSVGNALVETSAPTKRGARLPADWQLTAELHAIAEKTRNEAKLPPVDVATEHAKFCDYWHAKSGQAATKRDWVATWRNWVRNARGANGRAAEPFGAGMRASFDAVMSMIEPEPEEKPKCLVSPAK